MINPGGARRFIFNVITYVRTRDGPQDALQPGPDPWACHPVVDRVVYPVGKYPHEKEGAVKVVDRLR